MSDRGKRGPVFRVQVQRSEGEPSLQACLTIPRMAGGKLQKRGKDVQSTKQTQGLKRAARRDDEILRNRS